MKRKQEDKGISLVEVMVASVVGGIIIMSTAMLISVSLKSSQASKENTVAAGLLSEVQEAIKTIVSSNWHNIYDLSKGEPNHYKITKQTDKWVIESGEETITINNITFTRYFVVENVSRTNDNIDTTYNATNDDPSTQKVTAYIKWNNGQRVLSLPTYLTRSQNTRTFIQSDWSGGPGETGVLIQPNNRYDSGTNVQSLSD